MMGGSAENRHTPAFEHWSLAVKNGKALEKEWRSEIPIPRGGPHRYVVCLLLENNVKVFIIIFCCTYEFNQLAVLTSLSCNYEYVRCGTALFTSTF